MQTVKCKSTYCTAFTEADETDKRGIFMVTRINLVKMNQCSPQHNLHSLNVASLRVPCSLFFSNLTCKMPTCGEAVKRPDNFLVNLMTDGATSSKRAAG